ncbi:1-aminocyclopropane-1-carboxylate synthase [Aureococcus anophagefferens]|nr:1-aminocyclopropane-1-carboxylate synthase [Aureococcus anophagefferens]
MAAKPPPPYAVIITALGFVAAAAVVQQARRRKERKRQRRRQRKAKELALSHEGISSRGLRLNQPPLPYIGGLIAGFEHPYDRATGEGVVLLAVAENKLAWRTLKPKVEACLRNLPDWVANYGPMEGQDALRAPLAAFLSARVVPVRLDREKGYALTRAALDAAYHAAGGKAKALLLTNPHNPTGRALSRKELELAVDWCDRRRLHLVSDEIYALSAVGDADGFLSLGELTGGDLGPRRHVLWGLSKDFGMSGLRFGVTWTKNEKLLSALATAAVFTCVPGPCQAMVAALLSDEAFVDAYLAENARALAASRDACAAVLDRLRLPYLRPRYGMFLWCDFSSLLPLIIGDGKRRAYSRAALFEAEAALYDALLNELRVVLTPGASQHAPAGLLPHLLRLPHAWNASFWPSTDTDYDLSSCFDASARDGASSLASLRVEHAAVDGARLRVALVADGAAACASYLRVVANAPAAVAPVAVAPARAATPRRRSCGRASGSFEPSTLQELAVLFVAFLHAETTLACVRRALSDGDWVAVATCPLGGGATFTLLDLNFSAESLRCQRGHDRWRDFDATVRGYRVSFVWAGGLEPCRDRDGAASLLGADRAPRGAPRRARRVQALECEGSGGNPGVKVMNAAAAPVARRVGAAVLPARAVRYLRPQDGDGHHCRDGPCCAAQLRFLVALLGRVSNDCNDGPGDPDLEPFRGNGKVVYLKPKSNPHAEQIRAIIAASAMPPGAEYTTVLTVQHDLVVVEVRSAPCRGNGWHDSVKDLVKEPPVVELTRATRRGPRS